MLVLKKHRNVFYSDNYPFYHKWPGFEPKTMYEIFKKWFV